ncbi:MAG: tyrosine-type recombinase/integrase [Nitrososphaerota archaeon]|nr:tyrosine-type recombinase/integrase [Nitrososphaerota archaeon]
MTTTPELPVHDYQQRLNRSRYNIKSLPNGEKSLHFLDHLSALGFSVGRVSKYAAHLTILLRIMGPVDLSAMTRADVEHVIASINNRPNKASTKSDNKLLLRKLLQYAKVGSCAKGIPLPSEISWISLVIKEKNPRVTPESLLTPEDIIAILKAATNSRDKAMIYVLFEAALRPSELLTMRISSVTFKEGYCLIAANGKTGIKRIPLVTSSGPLLEWLEEHPCRADPQAPLWCALDNKNEGKRLSYTNFRLTIKRLARKAGLNKTTWPYLYRHTSLTSMAKVFTESRLEQFAGWTHGSKMTGRYVHFSARDLEDAILELHGLKTASKDAGVVGLVECPRCGSKNPIGKVRCPSCGMVIDKEAVLRLEDTQRQEGAILEKKNVELQTRLEKLEGVISALITSQNKIPCCSELF